MYCNVVGFRLKYCFCIQTGDLFHRDTGLYFRNGGLLEGGSAVESWSTLCSWNEKSLPKADEPTVVNGVGCTKKQREITAVK